MSEIWISGYHPNPEKCCAGCVFGGPHQLWCPTAREAFYKEVGWTVTKNQETKS